MRYYTDFSYIFSVKTLKSLGMQNNFGMLPADVLKYIALMSTKPEFDLVLSTDPNQRSYINISLKLMGISYKFFVEGKPYFTTEYSTEVNIREEIDFVVHSIDAFEKEEVVDFGSNQIFLNTTNIEFYSDHHELLIDIIYLPLVKDVLEKYKNFITTFR